MDTSRARETRVLADLLRNTGLGATYARARVDDVTAADEVWAQLRLALAYTADDAQVVAWFWVKVGRPREVVGAWGGLTEDLTLHMRPSAPHLSVQASERVTS